MDTWDEAAASLPGIIRDQVDRDPTRVFSFLKASQVYPIRRMCEVLDVPPADGLAQAGGLQEDQRGA